LLFGQGESVRQLIYQELNKLLPISTVGEYLRKWQFTSETIKELTKERITTKDG